MYRYLITYALLFILSSPLLFAQNTVTPKQWNEIESQLNAKGWAQDPKEILQQWKVKAIKTGDDITLARSFYNLLKIYDQRTEDSLYFYNSAFIDTVLSNPKSSSRLKAIMHVMQAQRLNSFTRYNRKFSRSTYHTPKLKFNYAALTNKQIDSLSLVHLQLALQAPVFKFDFKEYRWLSSNTDAFLFEPKFNDLVLAEQVSFGARRYHYYRDTVYAWLRLPSQQFRKKLASTLKNNDYETLYAYHQWIKYNESNAGIAAFIESLARKEIWIKTSSDTTLRRVYISYLQDCINSPYPELKAHAIYQLCLIWNEDGKKYANLEPSWRYNQQVKLFDKRYQDCLLKALQLYQENAAFMKSYPVFDGVLKLMVRQIKSTGVQVQINQNHVAPGNPIALTTTYRNADTLFYRIILNGTQDSKNEQAASVTQSLLKHIIISQGKYALPAAKDYNTHAIHLKLNGLEKGHYRILFATRPLHLADVKTIHSIVFGVGNLAVINNDERVFVLNRTTGKPVAGATVKAYYTDYKAQPAQLLINKSVNPVNAQGFTIVPENTSRLEVTFDGDTTITDTRVHKNQFSGGDVYEKDEDTDDENEDLLDYYDDNLRINIFTDRAIYRPEQTVHYKAILMTKDADTGLPVVFSAANLKKGAKMMKMWLDENKTRLILKDAFNKAIDSVKITVNEFGSFAGSFVIPKTAATGEWEIEADDIREEYANRGEFKVEEYKRPTLELVLEKPKNIIRPGQPFSVQLKLRSFSGAPINNLPVNYTLTRSGAVPLGSGKHSSDLEMADTTGYTDANGVLTIVVNDTLLRKYNLADSLVWSYTYNIEAEATDPTGETVKLNESVQAKSRPISINIPLGDTYDKKALRSVNVKTTATYEGTVGRDVKIKLYSTNKPAPGEYTNTTDRVDQWLYPKDSLKKWFPGLLAEAAPVLKRELVWETVVNTSKFETLNFVPDKILAGNYELIATTTDSGRLSGQSTYQFKVFDSETGSVPEGKKPISYLSVNSAKPGEKVTWYTWANGSTYSIYQANYVTGIKSPKILTGYKLVNEQKGLRKWEFEIPKNASENILLTRVYVLNNDIYKEEKTIYLQKVNEPQPEIIIEKYRKVMAPGSTETFSISIKTKNNRIAAELMTTLYDASLDKLERHNWGLLSRGDGDPRVYLSTRWTSSLASAESAGFYKADAYSIKADTTLYDVRDVEALSATHIEQALQGRLAGVDITASSGLNEIVTVGYGIRSVAHGLAASTAVIKIRGNGSLADYNQPLIVLNGKVFEGNLKDIDPAAIAELMVLKGADASAIYGSRGAQGVLILSTQGPIILPEPEKPPVKIRKNFNETAFFFPQIHAGADGFYSFTFTMPETATEWNWKMMAHTKDARQAYLQRTLQTQLNLMVQPNMPRLLYQGDRINLQSRISNLGAEAANCTVTCKIEDVATGQDITALLTKNNSIQVKLEAKSSGASGFMLQVPEGQQNPLRVVITVVSNGAADAEEHIIPVASTRVFVRQSVPLHFKNEAQLTVPAVKMPEGSAVYGVGLSINPKPQSALINALQWLANYPFNCAEQTFNKLRANVTALLLMRTDVTAQQAYQQALKAKSKDTATATATSQLPDELVQQAMPWLNLGNQTAKSQKQLFSLLDTVTAKITIAKHLDRLYQLQQSNGGLSWFDGGRSDPYISAYVLGGISQLKKQGWNKLAHKTEQDNFNRFTDKLSVYNQNELLQVAMADAANPLVQYMLYAAGDDNQAVKGRAIALIDAAWKKLSQFGLNAQTLLVINTLKHTKPTDPLYKKAVQLLGTIKQTAIVDEQNGMRWKDISDSDELSNSAEETLALLAEAFAMVDKDKSTQSGMVKWLLTARQDEHWQTTKATAAAINMLNNQKGGTFGTTQNISTNIASKSLQVNDDLLSGIPAAFATLNQQPQNLTLSKQGTDVHGSLTWYYFARPESLDTLNKGISIKRKLTYMVKDKGWQPLTPATRLKPGDKVRAELTIEAGTRLKYVYINDPRAAAFEPDGLKSEYRYSGNMGYYQSVRDAGMQFFADVLPRGTSTITYDLVVAHEGQFAAGPATLQCMYKPNVTAYSNVVKVVVVND